MSLFPNKECILLLLTDFMLTFISKNTEIHQNMFDFGFIFLLFYWYLSLAQQEFIAFFASFMPVIWTELSNYIVFLHVYNFFYT